MKHGSKIAGRRLVHVATAISALGGLLFGYDIGVISGAILFIKKDFLLSSAMEEGVVSSVLLGSLAGASVGGVLADRLGRRRLLIVTALVFGVGAIGAALAAGTAWRVVARVVAGAAIGVASFVAPLAPRFAVGLGPVFWLLLSEIYPLRIRGRAMSVATVVNWSANLLVASSFLTLTRLLGKAYTFWSYAAVSAGALDICVFLRARNQGPQPRGD